MATRDSRPRREIAREVQALKRQQRQDDLDRVRIRPTTSPALAARFWGRGRRG